MGGSPHRGLGRAPPGSGGGAGGLGWSPKRRGPPAPPPPGYGIARGPALTGRLNFSWKLPSRESTWEGPRWSLLALFGPNVVHSAK